MRVDHHLGAAGDATVLVAEAVLDSITYPSLRDNIIKAALDEPAAVIVDVSHFLVPAETAWVVFTSARWHVNRWPEIPIRVEQWLTASSHADLTDSSGQNSMGGPRTRESPIDPSMFGFATHQERTDVERADRRGV